MAQSGLGRTRYRQSSRLSPEDALQIWAARDAYRVQACWSGLCVTFFGLCSLVALLHGMWWLAVQIVVSWWLVQCGFPRLLRMVLRRIEDGVQWTGRKAWDVGREQWKKYQDAHRRMS